MSFPLLHLPSVAARYVLNQVDEQEAIKLGFCSKRARNLVKYERRVAWEKLDLSMSFGDCYHVDVKNMKNESRGLIKLEIMIYVEDLSKAPQNIDYWAIDGEKVPVVKKEESYYYMYFENRLLGTQKLISYMSDIFKIQVHRLEMLLFKEDEAKNARIAIDWVMSRQDSVQNIYVIAKVTESIKDDIRHVLNKWQATGKLRMDVHAYKNFDLSYLPLENGELVEWLTVDDLIRWDCRSINFGETNLKELEWNQFLKNWMTGGNPKLAHLEVGMEKLDIEKLINGLGATKVIHVKPLLMVPKKRDKATESWDITRNDGRMMSIVESWKTLYFYVWPEHE